MGGRAAEFWDSRSLEIVQSTLANYPPGLLLEGVREGTVRAVLLVDAQGKLTDCLVTAYTHEGFAPELLANVQGWQFRPAVQRGEAIGARVEVVFNFEARGQIIALTGSDAMRASAFGGGQMPLISLICPIAELDEVPQAVQVVRPAHPGKLLRPVQPSGMAAVDFYIDAEGRPRMPVVLRASHEEFGFAAVDAIAQWRFSPPRRGGRPVIVRAVQRFTFSDHETSGGGSAGPVAFARKFGPVAPDPLPVQ